MFLYLIFLVLLGLFAVIFISEFYKIIFSGYAPFISTKARVIKQILDNLEIESESDDVFELGCGKASFLRAVEKRFPQADKLIGVENSFWPYFLAGVQILLFRSKIKLVKEDLFKVDLSKAEIIYCFLNMTMMEKLKEKFRQECQKGAKIISYRFKINGWDPYKVLNINGENGNDKVYFYKIN